MDWDFAIERHRVPLLLLVAELFDRIGLTEDGVVERVPKPLYRSVLRVLRAAESAVRRLIFVAARNIVVEPGQARPRPKASNDTGEDTTKSERGASFKLFDPPKRFARGYLRPVTGPRAEPRIRFLDVDPSQRNQIFLVSQQPQLPAPAPALEEVAPIDDGTVSAIHLCRRLFAIKAALEDLQRQAMRLARWRAKPVEERRPERASPLRSGRPPGFRKRPIHEVDDILKECAWLARNVEPTLDTS